MEQFKNENELALVVAGFESCNTPGEAFTHAQHLVVAVWYIRHYGEEEALNRLRSGLLRFLTHHGVSKHKYNETTTLFWLKKVQELIKERSREISIAETTNAVIRAYPHSRLILDYFSEDWLNSEAARSHWVEPDLKR